MSALFPDPLTFARPVVRLAREMPVWGDIGAQAIGQGRGPSAVFLPARGPEGAALLRIYAVARALRARGWRVHVLPWKLTLRQRRWCLAAIRPDVVVMQGARHALNRPALYPGQRIVYDLDDADFHLDHLAGPVAEAMSGVSAVIAGSAYVADWCRAAGAGEAHVIWTGAPVSDRPPPPQWFRLPVVAWAQTRPMDYVREAALVRAVMARVAARIPGVTLRLFDRQPGDDPAFADSFAAPGLTVEWVEKARYRDYLKRFDDVAVGLAPLCPETPFSRGKSFGKVLAYLDRGVPVIASAAGEHGSFFTAETGVVSDDPDEWVARTVRFLGDRALRTGVAAAAGEAFRRWLTADAAADRVEAVLKSVIRRDVAAPAG
jgi:hypothetical protein